ncbi:unnamed protein product [Mytilus coruscus]|uniref:Integrase catalytic domain-containing protein n=1 Tax=Mytilus coruscus TaxID=42192 RepID=A0A6J8CR72_MYTCO|nr:unnamed protein product [Mytilus coruscus]
MFITVKYAKSGKNPAHKKRHALKTHLVGAPFERIATDIAGPFPLSDNKNRYVLVVGDYFTKLTEAYPMPDMQAETVADVIFRAWVKRYGCPIELHSDQGRQYESTLFQNMCELLEIKKTRTTPLHPRSDGMIERMNRTIQDILSKYIKSHQRDWDQHLDFLTMAYNSTPHESTGLTPHRLVYGQEMKFPLDVISERIEQDEPQTEFASDYANKLEEKLREAHKIAREHLKVASERQKFQYDENIKEKIYSDGQLVWRNQKQNISGKKVKICRNWTGPWVITKKLRDVLYRIQHAKISPSVVVHGDNLKPYRGSKKLKWFKQGAINENVTVSFPDLDNFLQSEDSEKDSENAEEFASDLPTELDGNIIPNHQNEDKCIENLPAVSKSPQKPEKEAQRNSRIILGKSPEARKTEAQFPHLKIISISPDVAPAQENQNSGKDKHYTTRKGRQIKVPEKFKDFIAKMSSAKLFDCVDCGKEYVSPRNLKRHRNQKHSEYVQCRCCPYEDCTNMYCRIEYMTYHLEVKHKLSSEQAKRKSRSCPVVRKNRTEFEESRRSTVSLQNAIPDSPPEAQIELEN